MAEIQPFDLRINGESVPVKNGKFTDAMNTAANGFVAEIVVNHITQPKLYVAISFFKGSPCSVSIEGELALTGKITKTVPKYSTEGLSYEIHGFSNTFNFIDSALTPPHAYKKQNLHQIATLAAAQTATLVKFDTVPGGIFESEIPATGETGFQFVSRLARKRNQKVSCTPQGALLLQQSNTRQLSVGSVDQDDPDSLIAKGFSVNADLRKRYKTYTVICQTPNGSGVGTCKPDKNIKQPRHTIITETGLGKGELNARAEWRKNQGFIDSFTFPVPVVGWEAPNKSIWKSNTLLSVKSIANFILKGFTFLITKVELSYDATGGKTAVLSLVPPTVYTDKPVEEPWFS